MKFQILDITKLYILKTLIIYAAKKIYLNALSISAWICFLVVFNPIYAQQHKPLSITEENITVLPDALGNVIPDFSYAGYKGGDSEIPFIAAKVSVSHIKEDATNLIQYAIDYVSKLPKDTNGFRGAIQLSKGTYNVSGTLKLHTSGVVLRGAGLQDDGTVILGTGKSRNTLKS